MSTATKTRHHAPRSTVHNIIEIVSSHHAFPSTLLLSPFLKSASLNNHDRWMIFVNPPAHLDRDTLQKMGVDPTSILVLHSNTAEDALQLTERALANGKGLCRAVSGKGAAHLPPFPLGREAPVRDARGSHGRVRTGQGQVLGIHAWRDGAQPPG